jgi:hypothetical protein
MRNDYYINIYRIYTHKLKYFFGKHSPEISAFSYNNFSFASSRKVQTFVSKSEKRVFLVHT